MTLGPFTMITPIMFVLKQSPLSCSPSFAVDWVKSAAASHTVKKHNSKAFSVHEQNVFSLFACGAGSETLSQEGAGVACGGASQSQLGVCKYMHDAPSYSLTQGPHKDCEGF